jgi:hypothetical protein
MSLGSRHNGRRRLGQDPLSSERTVQFPGSEGRQKGGPQLREHTGASEVTWPSGRKRGNLAGPVAQVVRAHA